MKQGRGRRYKLKPDERRYGVFARDVAELDEARDRLTDLVVDLPQEVLTAVPEGGENSIAWLVRHMDWAERNWLARVGGNGSAAVVAGKPPVGAAHQDAAALLADCERTRKECRAYLAALSAGGAAFNPCDEFKGMDALLAHLRWHWTYHTGQVGLLRRLLGERYAWCFG